MEEFILGLVWGILEAVAEGLLEYLAGIMVGVFWPGESGEEPIELRKTLRTCAGYLLLGALVGQCRLASTLIDSFITHLFRD